MADRSALSRSAWPPSPGARASRAARACRNLRGRSGRPAQFLLLWAGALLAAGLPPPAAPQSASAARDAGYTGHGGTRWSTDYGIAAGRCDRDASVGGAAPGTGRLLTPRLGGRLAARDRRCLGHVLELGVPGRQVGWTNGTTRQAYAVAVSEYTPSSSLPSGTPPGPRERCRVLLLTTTGVGVGGGARAGAGTAGRSSTETLVACQANPGVWSIR
jgi:hypothetical protein